MIWLLLALLVAAWCVLPLPLAVAVGRSLEHSSPDRVPPSLDRWMAGRGQ